MVKPFTALPPTLTLFLTPFLSLFHCGRLSLCFSSYLCRPCQVDHLIDNQGHQPTSKKLPPLNANSNGVHRPIYRLLTACNNWPTRIYSDLYIILALSLSVSVCSLSLSRSVSASSSLSPLPRLSVALFLCLSLCMFVCLFLCLSPFSFTVCLCLCMHLYVPQ